MAPSREPAEPSATAPRPASGGLVYVVADPEDLRRTDLWQVRLSDGAVRPLTQTPERSEEQPAWSQPAAALVVETRPAGAPSSAPSQLVLWKAGRDRPLPRLPAVREAWAAWAPLHRRVAYALRKLEPSGDSYRLRTAIALVDLETGEQRILAGGQRGERYSRPAFAPDGRTLAAQYRTRRPPATRIVLLDGEGEPRILTAAEHRATQPHFTPDGTWILFSLRRLGRGQPRDVMRLRPDGSELHALASTPESDDYAAVASPRRDEIAFLSDRDGKPDVFLAGLSGGGPRNLTASLELGVETLRWSPDGNLLALTAASPDPRRRIGRPPRDSRATARVLVIDRDGALVFETPGFAPDWMPPWG